MILRDAPELKELVTFVPNRKEPVHNWYWYKEGFGRGMADYALDLFSASRDSIVLDPFCGVGTTLLACKQRGMSAVGFDVNPLAVTVARAKTYDYNLDDLSGAVKDALGWRVPIPRELPRGDFLRKAFSRPNLGIISAYRDKIATIEDSKVRDFLLLALIDSATKCSWTVKDGALLRIERRPVPPVGKLFKWKIRKMLHDLKKNPLPLAPVKVEQADARSLPMEDGSVDFVITSPPYLNKIEYSRMYRLELSLFFGLPPTQLRSFVGTRADEGIETAYWTDVKAVLSELLRVCRPGAKVCWVVGGGCFPDHVVAADEETAKLAESLGFNAGDILVARRSWCTAQRTIKVGVIRESAVILEKP
jgi:SAM-dependent methyltransferase